MEIRIPVDKLLLVDDDPVFLSAMELELKGGGYKLLKASNRKEAVRQLENDTFELVICDLMMPYYEDGIQVILTAKKQDYNPAVLVITGYETVENAVDVMKAGADDFIGKGFPKGELVIRVSRILKDRMRSTRLEAERDILHDRLKREYGNYEIVGESAAIKNMMGAVEKVAKYAESTCLIQGETGTGKELVARNIHLRGPRRNKPFIPLDCAAVPKDLIESELFGHEKGAFTGAVGRRKGKFELADGGILFLDEISELVHGLQSKLLRVLEEKQFYRIGGSDLVKVDVMVLSATNRNLLEEVNKGNFREDLYYRLSAVTIDIPPFRVRPEDIKTIALHILSQFGRARGRELTLEPSALAMLTNYPFPGNGRELKNILERAIILADKDLIGASDILLNPLTGEKNGTSNLKVRLDEYEKKLIIDALARNDWVKSKAARELGIDHALLHRKMKRLNITKE